MKLYFKYFSIHIRSAMQYKASFLMTCMGQFLTSFSAFIVIYFMFARFNRVNSYTFYEVLICYATIFFSFSIAECFFRGFDAFGSIIGNGMFDRIMTRPRSEMFQVLASKIELSRAGRFIQALVVLIYAIPTCGIQWTPFKIFTLIMMMVGGTALFAGLFIIYASICFFTLEGLEFMNIFTDGGRELGTYPLDIYGKGVLLLYTFVIPLACVQYYPFLYIIGKSNTIIYAFLPTIGILFLIPCYVFWKIGVRHYKSTGS